MVDAAREYVAEQVPTGNVAWFGFLEMLALAFAFEGTNALLNGKPWTIWIPAFASSALFFLGGIKVPWIRNKLDRVDWGRWGRKIDIALRVAAAILIVSCVGAVHFALRESRSLLRDLAHRSSRSGQTVAPTPSPAPIAAPPTEPALRPVPGHVNWRERKNWRANLTVGMSEDQVFSLFGDPQEIQQSGNLTVWRYGSGELDFWDGSLNAWDEPYQ